MSNKKRVTKKGNIFIVSAPSGSGKTSLCSKLSATMPAIMRVVSVTTRAPRRGEKNKRDYLFVSDKQFDALCACDMFIEWAEVVGARYGTPKRQVLSLLRQGTDVILTIDVQGAARVKKHYPQSVMIFILPPSLAVLRQRLLNRSTETTRQINRRLTEARIEMRARENYDYHIINDTFKEALADLKAIVRAERCRHHNPDSTLAHSE